MRSFGQSVDFGLTAAGHATRRSQSAFHLDTAADISAP